MRKTTYLWLFCFCCAVVAPAQNSRFDSIARDINENGFFQYQRSKEALGELYEIARQDADSVRLLTLCIANEARLYSDHSIIDTTFEDKIQRCLLRLDSVENSREIAILDFTLGLYYNAMGDYGEAFVKTLQALEKMRQLNDSVYIAMSLNMLGMICGMINQPYLSNEYFTEQLAYAEKNSMAYFNVKQNQYLFLAREGAFAQFADSMKCLVSRAKEKSEDYRLIIMYLNLANAYLALDSLDIAHDYLLKCNEIIPQIDNDNLKIAFYSFFGEYQEMNENYQAAFDCYYTAYQLNKSENNSIHLRAIFYGLASCYEAIGKSDSVIHYLKKYREAVFQEEEHNQSIKVYQQYISNYLELTQNQLTIAQQDAELQKRRTTIIFITSILIAVVLLAIIIVIIQQRRRKKAEWKAKEILTQIEKKRQEELIAAKSREIVSYSLIVSNNHELLQKIAKLNAQIFDTGHDDVKASSREIEKLIRENQNIEKEWSNFKVHFEKVYPDFFQKLKTVAPNLSKDNLRLCAYIKIGFTTKEIAQILHVAASSVLNHRHRIRAKFNILKEEDLDDFIRSI